MSPPILVEGRDAGALAFAQEVARHTGAPLSELTDDGHVAAAIEEQRPLMVVLGSSGGNAERVIHGAQCPVVVVRGAARPEGIRTVGAAFAPTPEGREALRAAAGLAAVLGASLRVVTALSPKHAEDQSPGMLARVHHDHDASEDVATRHTMEAEAALSEAIAELGADVEAETDVLFQEPAHALVAASANLDLLVMGSRGLGAVRSVVLGSVSRHVTASASCPVLVVPRGVAMLLKPPETEAR